jgi:hypothetical protein
MFMMISFWGLTLASPILPLYWVKPAGAPKLIGAWQIFSFWVDFGRENFRRYFGFRNIQIRWSIQIDRHAAANLRTVN